MTEDKARPTKPMTSALEVFIYMLVHGVSIGTIEAILNDMRRNVRRNGDPWGSSSPPISSLAMYAREVASRLAALVPSERKERALDLAEQCFDRDAADIAPEARSVIEGFCLHADTKEPRPSEQELLSILKVAFGPATTMPRREDPFDQARSFFDEYSQGAMIFYGSQPPPSWRRLPPKERDGFARSAKVVAEQPEGKSVEELATIAFNAYQAGGKGTLFLALPIPVQNAWREAVRRFTSKPREEPAGEPATTEAIAPKTGGLWRKQSNGKGKFLVRRRDGTIPEYDCFVLGARDPSAAVALRAYADDAASRGRHPSYVTDVRQLANEFETYARTHGASQPDEQPTREDDPALVAKVDEGAAGKAPSDSFPTVSQAKAVILAHIGPANLMMGDPWYDPEGKEWKAKVSLSRSGPLVLMGFKFAKMP